MGHRIASRIHCRLDCMKGFQEIFELAVQQGNPVYALADIWSLKQVGSK